MKTCKIQTNCDSKITHVFIRLFMSYVEAMSKVLFINSNNNCSCHKSNIGIMIHK